MKTKCETNDLEFKFVFLLTSVIVLLFAGVGLCEEKEPAPLAPLMEGGVVFTFDDRNFDDWVKAIPLFDEFEVKATFFINGEIDERALNAIHKLKERGHSIGSHSVHHLKAVDYIAKRSTSEYMENEIHPQMQQFKAAGFTPTSFAYPMSNHNEVSDKTLLSVFRHIRTGRNIANGKKLYEDDQFFVPAAKMSQHGCLFAKGIDFAQERPDRTFGQIEDAMDRAVRNKEIIIFYAHRISETGTGNFIRPSALAHIFSKAKELNVKFYTMDELP